jgi:hypothetical protein
MGLGISVADADEHQPWQFVSEQCPARALGRDPGGGGYPGQGRAANRTGLRTAGLSKVQSVDQRMRLECGVGFRQLRTCRRTRPGQLCAISRHWDHRYDRASGGESTLALGLDFGLGGRILSGTEFCLTARNTASARLSSKRARTRIELAFRAKSVLVERSRK